LTKDHYRILSEFISQAKFSVKLYVGEHLDGELIEECARSVKRKVAVAIYFSDTIVGEIEEQPFIISKLYQLRDSGASIYDVSDFDNTKSFICQIDFETTLEIDLIDDGRASYFKNGESLYNTYQRLFDKTDHENVEFRTEQDDIVLSFNVDSPIVIEGTSITIHWKTNNASVVEIDGLGTVSDSGQQSLRILDDTIINIRASNQRQVKIKSLSINVIKQLSIDYDVQFFNPASKQYVSIKEESSSGVYGVTQGNKIKLVWDVEEAENVSIAPFDIVEKSGEHTFHANGTSEINIKANLQGNLKMTRIIIHEFPMPIFNHKLIAVDDKFLPNIEFEAKDLRNKAVDFLDKKGYLKYDKFTEELRGKAISYEKELISLYEDANFQEFYNSHSIPKLNEKIKTRLKSYFKEQPSVTSMIDSMRNYYE
jgi:hypothetical protein